MTAQDVLARVEGEGFKLRTISGSVRFLPRPDKQPSEDLRRDVRQYEAELVLILPVTDPGEPTPLRPETAPEPRQRTLLGRRILEGVNPPEPLIAGILYRGTVNSWHGEAGDGKTTIALWASLLLIQQGHTVLWLDEEAGPDQIAEKLEAMGANPEELDARFHYYNSPAFSMHPADLAELHGIVAAVKPALIVWDSAPDAFAAAKVHEDSADEITQWMRVVATPLARAYHCALVLLDHVTKSAEGRNGYARGSGAKKAKMDASFTVIKTADFDRNRLGVLSSLIRFTVGGRDGDLVCERHEVVPEQAEDLTPRDRAILKT
ncbi:MAG: AAA family ATPase, partial [Chloroflexota bacterium]|nr:AAA family ATPase [Chloroflexota bacterium]